MLFRNWLTGFERQIRASQRRAARRQQKRKIDRLFPQQRAEKLETRTLLTIVFDAGTGVVTATGTAIDEFGEVAEVDANTIRVRIGNETQQFARSAVTRVELNGGGGNDRLINRIEIPSLIIGGEGGRLADWWLGR